MLSSKLCLTDRNTTMCAAEVDIREGDCPHTDLIVCSGHKGGKRGHEWHSSPPGGGSYSHSYHVLLRDEALDETVRVLILVEVTQF